jgi:PAS domain S-box-containing protein
MKPKRFLVVSSILLFFLALTLSAANLRPALGQAQKPSLQPVSLQLRWDHQAQFAGYYAALWQGYYEEAGFAVDLRSALRPDGSLLSATREVGEGRADFGVGAADILIARDQGLPLVVVASIFQQSAAEFYALESTPLQSPSDLLKLKVARNVNDLIDIEMQAMLLVEGLDPQKVTPYPHQPGIAHLLEGRVEVMPGYRISAPYVFQQAGLRVKTLRPITYGIDFYGDSLFTNASWVAADPAAVERFRLASLKGWEYALEHPTEIADRISQELPRVAAVPAGTLSDFNRFQIEGVQQLSLYPLIQVGTVNPHRWQRMSDLLYQLKLVKRPLNLDEFIFDAAKLAASRQARLDTYLSGGLASLVAVILLIAAWTLSLRQSVARQTRELRQVNQQLNLDKLHLEQLEKNLRETEGQYRLLADNVSDVLWVLNLETRAWIYISPSVERLRGYRVEEALAQPVSEVMTVQSFAYAQAQIAERSQLFLSGATGEHIYRDEIEQTRRDGSTVWTEVITRYLKNEQGTLVVVGISRDITERKQVEQELQESETKYRTLLQNIQVGVVVHARETSILFSNPRASELLGLTAEQMRGKSAIDPAWCFIGANGARLLPEAYPVNLALQTSAPITNLILGILRPDRETATWVQCEAHQTWDLDGKVKQVVVTFADITEHQQAEVALKESEQTARRMARQLEVVYQMSAEISSGLDFEQLIERLYQQCQKIGDADTFYLALYQAETDLLSFPVFFKDGERRKVETRGLRENSGLSGQVIREHQTLYLPDTYNLPPGLTVLRQEGVPSRSYLGLPLWLDQRVVGVLSIQSHQTQAYSADQIFLLELLSRQVAVAIHNSRLYQLAEQELAERVRIEQQIRLLNEKLEQRVEERTRELREAQGQLVQQERLTVLGRLAGGVSQELRNPLGIIHNAIYFLRLIQPEADEKVSEYFGIIETEIRQADKIISDLLDFSRNQPPDAEPLQIPRLVQRVFEQLPPPENIRLTLALPENLPLIWADRAQMLQVLGNLVLNAYQAMPEGGELRLSAFYLEAEHTLRLSLRDTGPGVPLENQSKLFQPLFTTKPKGLGLGLALCRNLIEANGGGIEFETEPGFGATFNLFFPIQPE